ncbi:MAG TPA: SDR family NAD(P)-dependent oxidoreductase [Bacteroidota bacterium]|nr:SDR family NAD(P)-dependent oxidoreductase [Bacteroidota bacterium]
MLKGKVAVITGASTGIGEALAYRLAREGAALVLAARRWDRLEEVVARVKAEGGAALGVRTDVTVRTEAEAFISAAVAAHGRIDILVNNAGRGHFAQIEDTTDEMIKSMFELNVYSLWYTTRPALRQMRRQGSGHIINIASMAGKLGFPFNSAYVAAKHACVGFTLALRQELLESGIDASVVCPGSVRTEWATATEGGPMLEMFSASGPLVKKIAAERQITLPAIEGVLSPETIAEKIVDCVYKPVAEVYTHKGSVEFLRLAAENREEAERHQLPVVLGERAVYQQIKSAKP